MKKVFFWCFWTYLKLKVCGGLCCPPGVRGRLTLPPNENDGSGETDSVRKKNEETAAAWEGEKRLAIHQRKWGA